jgi:anti-anti-sigma regulatory factor
MSRDSKQTGSGRGRNSPCDGETIVLDEDLELAGAGVLLKQLRKAVDKKCSLVLDGSQVRVIDTASLQLLVAVFRQAQQQQTGISWLQPSESLRNNAALLGLDTHLCLASSAS